MEAEVKQVGVLDEATGEVGGGFDEGMVAGKVGECCDTVLDGVALVASLGVEEKHKAMVEVLVREKNLVLANPQVGRGDEEIHILWVPLGEGWFTAYFYKYDYVPEILEKQGRLVPGTSCIVEDLGKVTAFDYWSGLKVFGVSDYEIGQKIKRHHQKWKSAKNPS